ncbi:tetratricopeptide repeat protein [Gammaproteobacteria bacterium]|nr:tetratricopeptide repeat protein [Gammaproteobacteria bacterium]MDC1525385.1 tetratricopeptide repeat protein [Gammaproteobacteria bacterium]
MADYNSDEERFTAIADFLKRNKNTILVTLAAIALIAVTSLSINAYQAKQNDQAAELYDMWFAGMAEENVDLEKTSSTYNQLQNNFSKTGYAGLARLIKASQFARDGEMNDSLIEFQELLNTTSGLFGNDVLNSLARVNIARIEISNQNFASALEALESFNSESEHSMVYEIRGDALSGLGKTKLALDQYNFALQNMTDESQKSLLNIKINQLAQ